MNHLGTKTIETPRLILRRFVIEDAQAMYQNWASDPEVSKFLTWPVHGSVQVSRWVLSAWVDCYEKMDNYQWAIVLKTLGEPVGSISVIRCDELTETATIGYCIGRSWWHQGITTEALRAVMAFLFEEVGVNRIDACYDTNNPRSGAVMRRCGMRREGTLRQSQRNNQGICDVTWYAMLAEEWKEGKL